MFGACRTCLAKISSNSNPLYGGTTESTQLRKKLEAILPEIGRLTLVMSLSKSTVNYLLRWFSAGSLSTVDQLEDAFNKIIESVVPHGENTDDIEIWNSLVAKLSEVKGGINAGAVLCTPKENTRISESSSSDINEPFDVETFVLEKATKIISPDQKQGVEDFEVVEGQATNLTIWRGATFDLNFRSIPDSAVCSDCCTAISFFYQFKQRCLEIENNIQDLVPSLAGYVIRSNNGPSESDSPQPTNIKLENEMDLDSASLEQLCDDMRDECFNPEEASKPSQEENLQQLSELELVDIEAVAFNTDVMVACVETSSEKSRVSQKKAKKVKQMYICHDCGYKITYKYKFIKHVRKHRSQQRTDAGSKKLLQLKDDHTFNVYKCTQCPYTCKKKSTLNSHMINHNREKPYKCNKCDFKTAYSNYIGIHKKLHWKEKPLKCPKCDYRCVTKTILKLHLANHTGEKKYKCDKCDFQTQYRHGFNIHMRIHNGVKSFNCKVCDYSCITKCMLDSHLKTHTGEKPYKCSFCEHQTTQLSHLKIHLRIHTGEKPYKCDVCGYCTVSSTSLRQHLNIHLEDRPFKCSKCNYSTSQWTHMKIHLRQHTGERPFQCNACPYKASSGTALSLHMRTHTGEKPYKCPECDYASTQGNPLKVHMKKHAKLKDRPFKCAKCNFATVYKRDLKAHVKKH